jgi:hypothetical protein
MMRLLDLLRKKLCNQEAVKKPEPTTTTSGGGGLSEKACADWPGGGGGGQFNYRDLRRGGGAMSGGYAGKPECVIVQYTVPIENAGNNVVVNLPKGTSKVKLSWEGKDEA